MTDAREITLALGGKWFRRYGAVPCPVCQASGHKLQNALTLADGSDGRLLLNCKKSACSFLDILVAAGIGSGDYKCKTRINNGPQKRLRIAVVAE